MAMARTYAGVLAVLAMSLCAFARFAVEFASQRSSHPIIGGFLRLHARRVLHRQFS